MNLNLNRGYKCKDCDSWALCKTQLKGLNHVEGVCMTFDKITDANDVCSLGAKISMKKIIAEKISETIDDLDSDGIGVIAVGLGVISGYLLHGVVDFFQHLFSLASNLF